MAKVAGGVFERITFGGTTRFKPISGAKVIFLEVGNPSNAFFEETGADGRYDAEIPAGRYDTVVAATGYETFFTVNRPGHSVIHETPRVHVSNFFLEPASEDSVQETVLKKQASLQMTIRLPEERENGVSLTLDKIDTEITFDLETGRFELTDIPDIRNEKGLELEASAKTRNGRFDKATGHGSLTIDVKIDPDHDFFEEDARLDNVALSSRATAGTFVGSPLDRTTKTITLVGDGETDQPGLVALLNDKPVDLRLRLILDDIDGLI